jgi:hypothetical protein
MKPIRRAAILAILSISTAVSAASINMDESRRALGREDDVRIDAQLLTDTVSPGSAIGVTWQIQNFTESPVAVATRVVDATYDDETRTITLAIGSEVPEDGNMPVVVLIPPGEKKVFRAGATPAITPAMMRERGGMTPRYVQVKVTILRDLEPFMTLIQTQSATTPARPLSDELFERWFESTDTIFLNSLPVKWSNRSNKTVDVEQRSVRF